MAGSQAEMPIAMLLQPHLPYHCLKSVYWLGISWLRLLWLLLTNTCPDESPNLWLLYDRINTSEWSKGAQSLFSDLSSLARFKLMPFTLCTFLPLPNSTIFFIQSITMTTSYFPSLSSSPPIDVATPHPQPFFVVFFFFFVQNKTKPKVNELWGR